MILEITEVICQKMAEKKMTRKSLAEKLSISPPAVTKILNGNSNFTLKLFFMDETKRSIWAWALYDWANSAFATTVMAGFFPVFFKKYWSFGADVNMSTA